MNNYKLIKELFRCHSECDVQLSIEDIEGNIHFLDIDFVSIETDANGIVYINATHE